MSKVNKAIQLAELQQDREQMVAQLQNLSGALRYIDSKITALTQPTEEPKKEI